MPHLASFQKHLESVALGVSLVLELLLFVEVSLGWFVGYASEVGHRPSLALIGLISLRISQGRAKHRSFLRSLSHLFVVV